MLVYMVSSASSMVNDSSAVIGDGVMIARIDSLPRRFTMARTSRRLTIPITTLFASTTGTPPIPWPLMRASTSETVVSGPTDCTCRSIISSACLTSVTSAHSSSAVMFRWITPIPPSRAIAIAMAASVTVSIAAETSGMFSAIRREKRERVSVWSGSTPEAAGWSRTSSKVRERGASAILREYMVHRMAAMARARGLPSASRSGRRRRPCRGRR